MTCGSAESTTIYCCKYILSHQSTIFLIDKDFFKQNNVQVSHWSKNVLYNVCFCKLKLVYQELNIMRCKIRMEPSKNIRKYCKKKVLKLCYLLLLCWHLIKTLSQYLTFNPSVISVQCCVLFIITV